MPSLQPVPDCDGPKLEPFTDDLSSHEVKFLAVSDHVGYDSVVLKVRIDGHVYALKVFHDRGDLDYEYHISYRHDEGWKAATGDLRQKYIYHLQPFYRECRAFGRLKEVDREHLAVKVHGYAILDLTAKDLAKQIGDLLLSADKRKNKQSSNEKKNIHSFLLAPKDQRWQPRKCIVKDWIDIPAAAKDDELMNGEEVHYPRMLEDIVEFHECGIVLGDTRRSHYRNGILIDLGGTTTVPHIDDPEHGIQPSWTMASLAANDFHNFQTDVIDAFNETVDACISKGKPVPGKCTLEAYSPFVDGGQDGADATFAQRPLLPLIDGARAKDMLLEMWKYPQHDPADYDWRNPRSIISKTTLKDQVKRGLHVLEATRSNELPAKRSKAQAPVSEASDPEKSYPYEGTTDKVGSVNQTTQDGVHKRSRSASPVKTALGVKRTKKTSGRNSEKKTVENLPRKEETTAAASRPRRTNANY